VDPDGDIAFLDFATGYPSLKHDTCDDGDKHWHDRMDPCCVNDEIQAAIMESVSKSIRMIEPCYFWTRDRFRTRHEGLEAVQAARSASLPPPSTMSRSNSHAAPRAAQGTARFAVAHFTVRVRELERPSVPELRRMH
jgi:hypothetical protein